MTNPRTQVAKSEKEVEKARLKRQGAKQRKELLAMAAHDLLGPVGAIVVFIELLEEEVRDRLNATQRELLSNIRSAGETVVKLVDDLFAVSTRRLQLSLEPVDLVSLAKECISLHRPAAELKNISLLLRCEARLPFVKLDRLKILRVVNELLANAIRFSSPGQSIELRLTVRGRVVEVAVRDEGPGISPKEQELLFVPFHEHARSSGRGLGLAIAKAIVAAHRGRIRVKSRPRAGSTFSLSLPTNL